MKPFYAYVHARPATTTVAGVFYVGKGREYRATAMTRRSAHHQNIIDKYGRDNILVGKMECSSETIALALEQGLIRCLRRSGVTLANKTAGGESPRGYALGEVSAERRQKLSEAIKKVWADRRAGLLPLPKSVSAVGGKPKVKLSNVGRGKFVRTDAQRAALSAAMRGVKKTFKGSTRYSVPRVISEEQRVKLSEATKARWAKLRENDPTARWPTTQQTVTGRADREDGAFS